MIRTTAKPLLCRLQSYFMRSLSTEIQTAPLSLPPNLIIADMKIFEPPKPKIVPNVDFIFPSMNVPKTIKVKSFAGSEPSILEADLNKKIFSVALRKDIVHEVVRYQRNKSRQPFKTKRPDEIRGSGKKPFPQKGQGRSQVGYKRNSSWRGGFKAHGPVLRDFSIGLNRKYRALGMMIVLAAKFREGNLFVFDKLSTESHQTKEMRRLLEKHGLHDTTLLIVDKVFEEKFGLASRNLPLVECMTEEKTNVYDIIKREKLAISASAFEALQDRVMDQYLHKGKRKAFEASMKEFLEV